MDSARTVPVPTPELAKRVHLAVLNAPIAETLDTLNKVLDVSKFGHEAVIHTKFTVATSATLFQTQADGVLPRSHIVLGQAFPFKEFMKAAFTKIKYMELVFDDGNTVKSAWVLPVSAETKETGTLAALLRGLGAKVEEIDMDEEESE